MFQRIHPLCKIIDKIYLDKPYLLIKLLLCSSEKVSKMGNGLTFTEYSYKSHSRMSDVISVKKSVSISLSLQVCICFYC